MLTGLKNISRMSNSQETCVKRARWRSLLTTSCVEDWLMCWQWHLRLSESNSNISLICCFVKPVNTIGKVLLRSPIFSIQLTKIDNFSFVQAQSWANNVSKHHFVNYAVWLVHCLLSHKAAEMTSTWCGRGHISRRTSCVPCWSFRKLTTFRGLFVSYCYCCQIFVVVVVTQCTDYWSWTWCTWMAQNA